MLELDEEYFTPEERLEAITDIIARAVLSMIDDGGFVKPPEEKQSEPVILKERKVLINRKQEEREEFLKTKDIMRIFKISRTTLWRLRKRKRIPFYNIATSIRYKYSDILK